MDDFVVFELEESYILANRKLATPVAPDEDNVKQNLRCPWQSIIECLHYAG